MGSIISRGTRYSEIPPSALVENDLETILAQHSSVLAPDGRIVPFKCMISDGVEQRRADLAVVANDYSRWTVVEVEMSGHSLHGHVIPQISVLRAGKYGREQTAYLARLGGFRMGMLDAMMKGEPPDVVVVVDRHDEEWDREIRAVGCRAVVLQVYRSDLDEHALLFDGRLLSEPDEVISYLTCQDTLPRFLRIGSPAVFPIASGETILVSCQGRIVELERLDLLDASYLKTMGPTLTLDPGARYRLRQSGESYTLEKVGK